MTHTLQPVARDNSAIDVQIGQVLAYRYQLISELGRGGSSRVYKAYDKQKHELIAIKHLLLSEKYSEAERLMRIERFKQEANTLSLLNHPNIISVWEVLEIKGQFFMLMELLEGQSLQKWVDAEKPSYHQLLQLMGQLTHALEDLHGKFIVHRDIKPENVMVLNDGTVRLLDFGIAKLQGYNHLTLDGTILGTVSYMSPEQLKNSRGSNHQSDIYSLGVLMYELFTGQLPFEAQSPGSAILQIFSQEPVAPISINPNLGDDLNQLILTCMHKFPQHRFASCRQINRIIQLILERVFPDERKNPGHQSLMPRIRMFSDFKLFHVVRRLAQQGVSGRCWIWNANQEGHVILKNGEIIGVDIKNKNLPPQTLLCDLLSWESGNLMFVPGKSESAHGVFDTQSQSQLWTEASEYLSGFSFFWEDYQEGDIPEIIQVPVNGDSISPGSLLLLAWIDDQRSIGELNALSPQDRLRVAQNLKELEDRKIIFIERQRPH